MNSTFLHLAGCHNSRDTFGRWMLQRESLVNGAGHPGFPICFSEQTYGHDSGMDRRDGNADKTRRYRLLCGEQMPRDTGHQDIPWLVIADGRSRNDY